jgi:hypothetical protein
MELEKVDLVYWPTANESNDDLNDAVDHGAGEEHSRKGDETCRHVCDESNRLYGTSHV